MTDSKSIRKTSNINALIMIIWMALVFGFAYFSESFTALFVRRDSPIFDNAEMLILFLFQYIIAVPIPLLIFGKLNKIPKLKTCFQKPKMPAKWVFRWIFISLFFVYASVMASNMFFNIIQMIFKTEFHAIDMTADDNMLSKFTNIAAMMFLAPFFEEILYRGTFVRNGAKHGTWSSVIVFGIMFGLWHCNYAQSIYTTVLGICTGFLILKTESILPPMLLHFCMNTLGAISSVFVGSIDIAELSKGSEEYMMNNLKPIIVIMAVGCLIIGIVAVGLVLFVLEIIFHKDSFKLEGSEKISAELKKAAVYYTAPVTIITVIIMLAMTIKNAIGL